MLRRPEHAYPLVLLAQVLSASAFASFGARCGDGVASRAGERTVLVATSLAPAGSFTVLADESGKLRQLRDGAERVGPRLVPVVITEPLVAQPDGPVDSLAVLNLSPRPFATSGLVAWVREGRAVAASAASPAAREVPLPPGETALAASWTSGPGTTARLFVAGRRGLCFLDVGVGELAPLPACETFATWDPTDPVISLVALGPERALVARRGGGLERIGRGTIERRELGRKLRAVAAVEEGGRLVLWALDDSGLAWTGSFEEGLGSAPFAELPEPFVAAAGALVDGEGRLEEGWREGWYTEERSGRRLRLLLVDGTGSVFAKDRSGRAVPVSVMPSPDSAFGGDEAMIEVIGLGLALVSRDAPSETRLRLGLLRRRGVEASRELPLLRAWASRVRHARYLEISPEIGERLGPGSIDERLLLLDCLGDDTLRALLKFRGLDEDSVRTDLEATRALLDGDLGAPGSDGDAQRERLALVLRRLARRLALPEEDLRRGFLTRYFAASRPLTVREALLAYLPEIDPLWTER